MPPVFNEKCTLCGDCVDECPGYVLEIIDNNNVPEVVYPDECWHCGGCKMTCPVDAVTIEFPLSMML